MGLENRKKDISVNRIGGESGKHHEECFDEDFLSEIEICKAFGAGLWDWNLNTNRVTYSDEWKRQIGHKAEEIGDELSEWESRIHPDDLETTTDILQKNIKSGSSGFEISFRLRHKNGSYRNIFAKACLVKNSQGDPVRMFGMNTDISGLFQSGFKTGFDKTEPELNIEATKDGICKWNLITNELELSPGYYTMLGYQPGELSVNLEIWKEMIHPKDLEGALSVISEYLENKPDVNENEFRVRKKNGEYIWVRSSARMIKRTLKGEAVFITCVHHDITEQKQQELELIQKKREIEEKNFLLERKNVALSELVAYSKRESELLQKRISNNIEEIILPIVSSMSLAEGERRVEYEKLLKRSLRDLLTERPAGYTRPELGLTPREIQVCEMIKQGLSSKEIGRLLNIDKRGVDSHRMNIRKKLDLVGRSTNLVAYLKSL